LLAALVGTAGLAATGFVVVKNRPHPERTDAPATAPIEGGAAPGHGSKPGTVGGVPLFATWPKEQPDLALVLSGQTHGYLSPCGCSRPQKGGLERRANFFDELRQKKGWTVIGLDLGDVTASKGVGAQIQLKYQYTMKSLAAMGYAAVGLGDHDFGPQLFNLLTSFTLNNPNKPPFVLAGNLVGVQRGPDGMVSRIFPREEYFTGGPDARPMVGAAEVFTAPDKPAVAVVGVVGKDVGAAIEKQDSQFGFQDAPGTVKTALGEIAKNPAKPDVKVLLYAGSMAHAQAAAKLFPEFNLILCQTEESEPPQFPTMVNGGATMIVQVGHKGQNVGVVGVFKKPTGGVELKYQLVPLGEEYLTPEGPNAEKNNKVLGLLEEYAAEVQKQNLLGAARVRPLQHAAQIQNPAAKLTYVGAEKCAQCHAAEYGVWKGTKHAHAYEALVNAAYRPKLRQFDPECVVCHTTGFEFVGGFDSAEKTPHLMGNQCENCHGPGSGHSAEPNNKALYQALMPWKQNPNDKLPDVAVLKAIADLKPLARNAPDSPLGKLAPNQTQLINAVSTMCMKCHDGENDPKFDFFEYFPKVYHSGLKNAGLPPGAK
jgi:2',3'-cyclic-nucleotide 2'-phosphodiesterase (5'-nucleotidase family)